MKSHIKALCYYNKGLQCQAVGTKGKGKLGYPVGKVALLPLKPEEKN